MLDIRSTLRKVNSEQRKYPRLELQCKAVVRGYNGIFTITDISLGGLFIEPQGALIVKIGQVTDISIKLPEQDKSIQVKAKFISQNKRGIGCAFIALSPENKEVLNKCIEAFNHTLPIRDDEAIKSVQHPEKDQAIITCPQCRKKKRIDVSRFAKQNLKVKMKCSCSHSWELSIRQKNRAQWKVNSLSKHQHIKYYPK